MQKRRFWPTICTMAVVLLTSACGQKSEPVAPPGTGTSGAATSSPVVRPGLTITSPRLVLPAIGGRPAAAYFTIANTGDRPETITGVAVRGAEQAQMHETNGGSMTMVKALAVPSQGSAVFAPGGRHVMVFGVPANLRAGGTSELKLSFANGQHVSAQLVVVAAGTGEDAMAGMHMDH